ncbi:MAG: hypothetical protein ACI9J2_001220, partial [Saprospiraceae bacterium]
KNHDRLREIRQIYLKKRPLRKYQATAVSYAALS